MILVSVSRPSNVALSPDNRDLGIMNSTLSTIFRSLLSLTRISPLQLSLGRSSDTTLMLNLPFTYRLYQSWWVRWGMIPYFPGKSRVHFPFVLRTQKWGDRRESNPAPRGSQPRMQPLHYGHHWFTILLLVDGELYCKLAEAAGFEPAGPCEPPAFETGAIDLSATLPKSWSPRMLLPPSRTSATGSPSCPGPTGSR